jgi:menaquinone-specific isochorismate synthase
MTPIIARKKSPKLDLPAVLSASSLFPKFYIKCPKTGEERVALGSSLTLTSLPENLPKDPSLCFYGTIPFAETKSPLWKDFQGTFFFLPVVEIIQTAGSTEVLVRKEGVSFPLEAPPLLEDSCLKQKDDDLAEQRWNLSIETVLQKIDEGVIDKVALARKTAFELYSSPFSLLQRLIQKCPSTSTFAFQRKASSLFLGSTPEKLYERNGKELFSEAIAGTRKRGQSLKEDAALGDELLKSAKDMQEVLFVKEFVQKQLEPFSEIPPTAGEATLVKTEKVQHLRFPFKTTLKKGVTDAELIRALHPTPAVGGTPTSKAKSLIESLEDFERGLYAGLTGWITPFSAKFYVAIRSGLVQGSTLHTFAGAGIVKGSQAKKEWEELNHKTAHWVDA